jgi:hypothetical protein
MISLLDSHGVRHSIDLETWVSGCAEWVVQETDGQCCGRAARFVEERTATPVYTMGSRATEYVAGIRTVPGEEARFAESDLPITCLACVAEVS